MLNGQNNNINTKKYNNQSHGKWLKHTSEFFVGAAAIAIGSFTVGFAFGIGAIVLGLAGSVAVGVAMAGISGIVVSSAVICCAAAGVARVIAGSERFKHGVFPVTSSQRRPLARKLGMIVPALVGLAASGNTGYKIDKAPSLTPETVFNITAKNCGSSRIQHHIDQSKKDGFGVRCVAPAP